MDHSGSVRRAFKTRDQRVASSSLTSGGVTVLCSWARHFIRCLVLNGLENQFSVFLRVANFYRFYGMQQNADHVKSRQHFLDKKYWWDFCRNNT